jgi:hypothetical protein
MAKRGKLEFVIEWERILCAPDGARCFSCGDPFTHPPRRPVCVVSRPAGLQHHVLSLLVCDTCYVIAVDHLAPRPRIVPSVS